MSYILGVELIVLAARLNVEDERKTEVMEDPWISALVNFMEYCHLLSSFNSGGRSCFGEWGWGEDDEFSFGHLDFELEYPSRWRDPVSHLL